MTTTILIAMAIAVAAGLLRGFAGVGSSMFMAPFFVQIFGPVDTVAIVILMEVVVTAQLLPAVHRDIDWRVIAPMGLSAAALMPLGNWLLMSLDAAVIGTVTASVVILFALILMTGWQYHGAKPLGATLGVGAASGTLMAITGLGNPPVMLYLLSSTDKAATNRANFTGYFAVTLTALIVLMAAQGLIGGPAATTVLWLLPAFMIAVWGGSRMFRKSSEALYRRIALATLLCAGIYGLLR